jgi:hypothetical protein
MADHDIEGQMQVLLRLHTSTELTTHVSDFFSHPRRRVVWAPPESLYSLSSLPKTMRCDKFSGPGSISLSQGWDRWLGVVEPQIEAGALVQRVEDAIQGDLRLVIARQQGEDKGRDWLTQRESNKRGTRPL